MRETVATRCNTACSDACTAAHSAAPKRPRAANDELSSHSTLPRAPFLEQALTFLHSDQARCDLRAGGCRGCGRGRGLLILEVEKVDHQDPYACRQGRTEGVRHKMAAACHRFRLKAHGQAEVAATTEAEEPRFTAERMRQRTHGSKRRTNAEGMKSVRAKS